MFGREEDKKIAWLQNTIVIIHTSLFLDQECNFFFINIVNPSFLHWCLFTWYHFLSLLHF